MCVSTVKNTEMYVNIHLDLLKETSLMYVFLLQSGGNADHRKTNAKEKTYERQCTKRGNLQNNNADMQNVGRSRNVGS